MTVNVCILQTQDDHIYKQRWTKLCSKEEHIPLSPDATNTTTTPTTSVMSGDERAERRAADLHIPRLMWREAPQVGGGGGGQP